MVRFTYLFALMLFLIGCVEHRADTAVSTGETTPVAFNAEGAPTVEFSVPDMMCPEGCGAKTKEILSEQPGAKEVVINFEAKTATVAVDEGTFDSEAAIAALVDYGFDNSTLKPAAGKTDGPATPAEQPAG